MEVYLLKSSLALIVLFLLYKFILHRETNNQVKRIVGLACVVFSTCFFLVPKLELLPVEVAPVIVQSVVENSTIIQENFTATLPQDSPSIFLIAYLFGAAFFFLRFILGIASLAHLYIKSEKMTGWGFTVVATDKKISPFTFFNLLFISKEELQHENIHGLIEHEQVHRKQKHTIDLLILQLLSILHWFNPIMWLFQKDIRAQHEYLADEEVLKKGFDKLDYQQMLFEEQTGVSFQSVNYLSIKTSLKQRFNMMEKTKINTRNSYFKAALFLPAMVITVFISSFAPALEVLRDDTDHPKFTIYTANGEVDLKKGISKETKMLYVRASLPEEENLVAVKVSKIEATLIIGGLRHGTMLTGESISISRLVNSIQEDQELSLILDILVYQTKNVDDVIKTKILEEPIVIKIPLT